MKKITISIIILLSSIFCFAANDGIPARPYPPKLVNDIANILSTREENALENKLVNFANSSSCQIVVLTIPDLGDYQISDFAFSIGEKWGVGQKGEDNGIIMVVKPKIGNSYGEAYIAVGYGLEEVVTDAASKIIIENEMIPRFKENNYYGGIEEGTNVLMDISSQKYSSDEYVKSEEVSPLAVILSLIPMIVFIILIIAISKKGGGGSGHVTTGALPWILFGGGGSHRGGSSHGGFGGGSSGGFGGFGGGSFGGGGAGGRW